MQRHAYRAYSRQTLTPLFALSVSLCAKIASPGDITHQTQTQSPTNSVMNQIGAYFQNFGNNIM